MNISSLLIDEQRNVSNVINLSSEIADDTVLSTEKLILMVNQSQLTVEHVIEKIHHQLEGSHIIKDNMQKLVNDTRTASSLSSSNHELAKKSYKNSKIFHSMIFNRVTS
ncbi:hypothetical protein G7083_10985 [Vibrio sp. HDW18]|uniref:hypothetical protein n=1 Tax=Vibrio sp. HDW18 TaxID=2714948 RepID=UPI00140AE2FD|nr:hypothetical protein [Vibrio sp. HDW18]QIL86328.1 hypothetical protein G7083_10985 [Vibrio sp. HDW18]